MTDPVIAPERRGRCLELAGRHVMHHDAALIHGSVITDDTDGNPITIFHAWTEQADGLVYDTEDEVIAEGFDGMFEGEFCRMWMESHGYGHIVEQSSAMDVPCRRIEWRYLGDES